MFTELVSRMAYHACATAAIAHARCTIIYRVSHQLPAAGIGPPIFRVIWKELRGTG